MYWTARSTSGEKIPEGTLIRADRIEGVKVYVSPAEVPANT
jgi:membrane protein implicated in regulation of membrane protease activity